MTSEQIKLAHEILDAMIMSKHIEIKMPAGDWDRCGFITSQSSNQVFSLIEQNRIRIKPEPTVEWVDIDEGTELKVGDIIKTNAINAEIL